MADRAPVQVLAERLAAHRNGLASDGRGWFRAPAEKTELTGLAQDLTAELHRAGYALIAVTAVDDPDLQDDPAFSRWWAQKEAEGVEDSSYLKLLTADAFSSGRSSRQPGETDA